MKVTVSAVSGSLDAQVDPRFGRGQYFVIVDSDSMTFEALPNASRTAPRGAGIQAVQTIANKGAKVVLTGNVGPNAYQAFSAAGIQMITGVSGTVREAVEKFKRGQLRQTATAPIAPLGFGMGDSDMGMGRGGGRRMGGGRGVGYRRWQTTDPYVSPTTAPTLNVPQSSLSKEQEIQLLGSQMETMQQQLDQIKTRLKELKK